MARFIKEMMQVSNDDTGNQTYWLKEGDSPAWQRVSMERYRHYWAKADSVSCMSTQRAGNKTRQYATLHFN